jgi:hypothetical protein
MKFLSFALAAVAAGTVSGSAQAQCNCGRGYSGAVYQPAYQYPTVVGRPVYATWPGAPVAARPAGSCCAGGVIVHGGVPSCHAAAPVAATPGMAGMAGMHAAVPESPPAAAADGKEVKVTGTLVCGKCQLKETAKCSNVLQVKEKDKVVNYYLIDKGNGETYHEGVCGGDKVENVTVAGKLTEKDGKKWVTPTKVELPKK